MKSPFDHISKGVFIWGECDENERIRCRSY